MTSEKAKRLEIASEPRPILTPVPPAPEPEVSPRERNRQLKLLLEGKRYEEALELLLRVRAQSPEDPAISRGIRLLKDRLVLSYTRRLGDLERVLSRGETPIEPLSRSETTIYELVDGIASIEDVVHASSLGRFETYRCLVKLLGRGVICLAEAAPWSLPVADPRRAQERPPQETDSINPVDPTPNQGPSMSNISESLGQFSTLDGFVGASLVDSDSGMVLGMEGGGKFNVELASALNTEVVRAKRKAMDALGLGDQIDDILITLKDQYHVIRPMKNRPQVFIYLVTERAKSNLALARMRMSDVEKALKV
ncbi:MAG: hypothetical protein R3B89_32535 [Polyangiaceae bacterium]